MPTLFFTTCGTSLLSNLIDGSHRKRLFSSANAIEPPLEERAFVDALTAQARESLATAAEAVLCEKSAEINCLLGRYAQTPHDPRDHHVLIASDTYQGRATAELIRAWMQSRGWSAEVMETGGLRTDDEMNFRCALSLLVKNITQKVDDLRPQGYRAAFNLTGGFKGVTAFLQVVSVLWGDESLYVFEKGGALISIPRLPVSFSGGTWMGENFDLVRRMKAGGVPASEARGAPEALVLTMDDTVILSEWGEALWPQARDAAYEAGVVAPLGGGVRLGPQFARSVRGLSPDRLRRVNSALEALAAWRSEGRPPPMSHKIKPLGGDPVPGSTHEIYAWSDQDAKRLYFHLNGAAAMVDKLEAHL